MTFYVGNHVKDHLESYADIRNALLRFRFDKEFHQTNTRVPIRQFAKLASISRQALHDITSQKPTIGLKPETARRIRAALELVLVKGVRWHRRKKQWVAMLPDGTPLPPQPQLPRMTNGSAGQPARGNAVKRNDNPNLLVP